MNSHQSRGRAIKACLSLRAGEAVVSPFSTAWTSVLLRHVQQTIRGLFEKVTRCLNQNSEENSLVSFSG